jgi:hypothetical protein
MPSPCTHLDQIRNVEPRTPEGCEECLQTGDRWVHLRLCLTCGHVGCCDASPNRHATKHFHATEHPIIQSFEPNEDWGWCYVDQVILEPAQVEAALAAAAQAASAGDAAETAPVQAGQPGGLLSRMLGSRYRRNYLVGVIDDREAAERAEEALQRDGFTAEDLVLQTGSEIEARLQREDLGNLVREATTEEGAICRDYDEMSRGGALLSVYATTPAEVERAGQTLAQHGAHSLRYFGDWTISEVRPEPQSG